MDRIMGFVATGGDADRGDTGNAEILLTKVAVTARVRDLFCDVTIEQHYENREKSNLEAVYTFPLPLDAVLLDVQVRLGDRELRGKVVPKAEAEEAYEEAIAEGDAAIRLERIEPGMYAINVGNLQAGEKAVIRMRYGQLLRWSGDDVRFHIPTTIAPRYGTPAMPPHQVPQVDLFADNRFSLDIQVAGMLAAATIECPSHRLATRQSKAGLDLSLAGGESFMDRDFVLNFNLADGTRSSAVSVSHKGGRVALLSWRPTLRSAAAAPPQTIKIVVDCSGSMNGDSIEQAGSALRKILEALRPEDRFDIVRFGSGHQALFGELRRAVGTDLAQAIACADGLKADMGGTEIGAALYAAYQLKGGDAEIRPDILLITDGQINDADAVVKAARKSGHRIFTVGVGASVAEAFVRQLATETGGACELVSPNEDMAGRIVRHFRRMSAARAMESSIQWPGKVEREVLPAEGAVYDGDTVQAFAWLSGDATGSVKVRVAQEGDNSVEDTLRIEEMDEGAASGDSGHPIARMAAAALIAGKADDSRNLALEYQLLTEFTDFLVVHERAEEDKATESPVLRTVTGMLAAGWGGVGRVESLSVNYGAVPMRCLVDSADFGAIEPLFRKRDATVPLPERHDWEKILRTIEKEIDFDYLTGRLKNCNLEMLLRCGVPKDLVQALRQAVREGLDEYEVVLAGLVVLTRTSDGPRLSHEAIRAISKAASGVGIEDNLLARIAKVVAVTTGQGVNAGHLSKSLAALAKK